MGISNLEDRSLTLDAPAKVNLFLRVLARRPDGYHELETWMQKLTLYDRIVLTVRKGAGIRLRCTARDVPADETNLAWKAAAALFSASRYAGRYGVDIALTKNIPVAAGLGGGSSDAGTVLKGLNTLLGGEFSQGELLEFGRQLGADVPFFVSDHPAVLATGIGEKMIAVPSLTGPTFLLVNPGFSVSTRWVYENFALTRGAKNSTLPGFQKSVSGTLSLDEISNDLEELTIGRYPELGEIKRRLRKAGAIAVLMSGSGPTVFGVFPGKAEQGGTADIPSIAQKLRRDYGENVFIAKAVAGA